MPPTVRASVSRVPSISASPEISRLPASSSPDRVIAVAPVTTPASTLIVPSRRIAEPAAGFRFSAAAEVTVKAPELVDQVEAPAAVIVMGFPASVAPVVPSWVIVKSPSTPSLKAAESDIRNTSFPNTASFTTLNPPSA